MSGIIDKLTDKEAMDWISKLEEPFKSLPHLPAGIVEFFVKIAPYLALLGAILSVISGPVVGIFGTLGSILTFSPLYLITTIVYVVVELVCAFLLFTAYGPLQKRELKGWVLMFWSNMVSLIASVAGLLSYHSNIISTIIGVLIGLYILFEMKPYYAGKKAVAEKAE